MAFNLVTSGVFQFIIRKAPLLNLRWNHVIDQDKLSAAALGPPTGYHTRGGPPGLLRRFGMLWYGTDISPANDVPERTDGENRAAMVCKWHRRPVLFYSGLLRLHSLGGGLCQSNYAMLHLLQYRFWKFMDQDKFPCPLKKKNKSWRTKVIVVNWISSK